MRGVWGLLRRVLTPGWRNRPAELTAAELQEWLAEGRPLQLLDIREERAFRAARLPGARYVPLGRLEEAAATLDRGLATVVY